MPVRPALATLAALALAAPPAVAQNVEYRSHARVEYRAQADTGPIARAEAALAADPRNVQRIIQLGVAQSGARQFREAIETFTRGLAIAPNDPMLYRWRGHRYLSVRDFDRAMEDLTRGYRIDSTNYGILYHLGVLRYALGDYNGAADAFRRAQPRAPDAGELAGATDWLWMSLSRAGRGAEAKAMLDRRPDSLPTTVAYAQRLKLYRGEIGPEAVFTAADTGDVAVATLSYGIGNWYLVRGDTAKARSWFERSVASGGWPAFGFIVSELELNTGGSCVPRSERVANELGCFITATEDIGTLPANAPIFWHIDAFPTRAAADAVRPPRGTVVEAYGRTWLFTIGPAGRRPAGGQHIADVGPLPVTPGGRYTAQYMEATFRPGMKSRVHRHPGPEAWHTLTGAMCLETPAGKMTGRAGEQFVIVPGGPPMELTATGTEVRRSLALVLHDSSQPASVLAPDWTPKGLCAR
jgi:tetratricopeptide (TPR) repeat protein/quercetin dioxygenase-like cupin family protein